MKKLYMLSIIFLALATLSFRWPLDNGKITSTFGESRADHFHDGVDMVAGDFKVHPVADGKLLYCWNKALFPFDNYTGSGNYQIVSHNESGNKIYSVYLHLEDSLNVSDFYSENDVVGKFANTGRSYGAHIHFGLVDSEKLSSINAYEILPLYADTKPPVFGNLGFRIEKKVMMITDKSKVRLTDHRPLLINIYDVVNGGEKLGIYRLKAEFNGKIVEDVTFDKLIYGKNGLTFSGLGFNDLYDESGAYKLSGLQYQQGINTVKITAFDFAGNSTEKIYTLDVNLDM